MCYILARGAVHSINSAGSCPSSRSVRQPASKEHSPAPGWAVLASHRHACVFLVVLTVRPESQRCDSDMPLCSNQILIFRAKLTRANTQTDPDPSKFPPPVKHSPFGCSGGGQKAPSSPAAGTPSGTICKVEMFTKP